MLKMNMTLLYFLFISHIYSLTYCYTFVFHLMGFSYMHKTPDFMHLKPNRKVTEDLLVCCIHLTWGVGFGWVGSGYLKTFFTVYNVYVHIYKAFRKYLHPFTFIILCCHFTFERVIAKGLNTCDINVIFRFFLKNKLVKLCENMYML